MKSIQNRVGDLEKRIVKTKPGCCRTLLIELIDGETGKEPTDEQLENYLKESGLCGKCRGECIIVYNGESKEIWSLNLENK